MLFKCSKRELSVLNGLISEDLMRDQVIKVPIKDGVVIPEFNGRIPERREDKKVETPVV